MQAEDDERELTAVVLQADGCLCKKTEEPRLITPLLAMFDLDSIGLLRRAMANRFCIRMKEHYKNEPESGQRVRTQAMNTSHNLQFSTRCRKLIDNIILPLAGEAIDARRKRTLQFLLDKIRSIATGKGLGLALSLPNSTPGRLGIRWHLGNSHIYCLVVAFYFIVNEQKEYVFLRRIGLKRLLDQMNILSMKKLEPNERDLSSDRIR